MPPGICDMTSISGYERSRHSRAPFYQDVYITAIAAIANDIAKIMLATQEKFIYFSQIKWYIIFIECGFYPFILLFYKERKDFPYGALLSARN